MDNEQQVWIQVIRGLLSNYQYFDAGILSAHTEIKVSVWVERLRILAEAGYVVMYCKGISREGHDTRYTWPTVVSGDTWLPSLLTRQEVESASRHLAKSAQFGREVRQAVGVFGVNAFTSHDLAQLLNKSVSSVVTVLAQYQHRMWLRPDMPKKTFAFTAEAVALLGENTKVVLTDAMAHRLVLDTLEVRGKWMDIEAIRAVLAAQGDWANANVRRIVKLLKPLVDSGQLVKNRWQIGCPSAGVGYTILRYRLPGQVFKRPPPRDSLAWLWR